MHYEDSAKELVGNWKEFSCFVWHSPPEDADNWTIQNLSNRDSGILAESNEHVIRNELKKFDDDVSFERHNHWAVGHVNATAIRVYDKSGNITEAFKKFSDLRDAVDYYPILDDSDYSDRAYKAAIGNIEDQFFFVKVSSELKTTENAEAIYRWLADNNESAIENDDLHGAMPSEDEIMEAMIGLGLVKDEFEDE